MLPSTAEALRLLSLEKPSLVVAVGDRTSKSLAEAGVKVSLYIVDGRVERKPFKAFKLPVSRTIKVRNPAGTLSLEALETMRKIFERLAEPLAILVEGEEDLLTLAVLAYAPLGTLVFYGQPGEGLVAVKVNGEKRDYAMSIIEAMPEVEV